MRRIIFVLLYLMLLALPVSSAEYEYSHGDTVSVYPEQEINDLFSSLPDQAKNEISDFITAEDDEGRVNALKEKLDAGFWIRYLGNSFSSFVGSGIRSCAGILCIILLTKTVSSTVLINASDSVSPVFNLGVSLVCSVSVVELALKAVNTATGFVNNVCSVMTAMLPVMEAVLLSSGKVTQASVNATSLMIYVTITQNFMKFVLIPLAGALLALSTCSCTLGAVNVSSLTSALRRILFTVLGFFLMIFSFVLGIQNSLAQSADTLAMKTVRFAVGSYVPVVGGALSEALTTVSAGLSLVRRTVGGIGIVIILFTVLPPLISLFVTRLALLVCKSAADILECHDASRVIGEADGAVSLFCAFAVMTSIFFIFAVLLFLSSSQV